MIGNKKKLVAVYGSLLSGLHNHRVIQKGELVGTYVIPSGFYSMYSLGSFPFVTKDARGSKIKIEVYAVDDATYNRVENLEGYPSFYQRESISTPYGEAEIYYIENPDEYSTHNKVSNGDWRTYIEGG